MEIVSVSKKGRFAPSLGRHIHTLNRVRFLYPLRGERRSTRCLLLSHFGCHLHQLGGTGRVPDAATQHNNPSEEEQAASLVGGGKGSRNKVEESGDTKANLAASKGEHAVDTLSGGSRQVTLHGGREASVSQQGHDGSEGCHGEHTVV